MKPFLLNRPRAGYSTPPPTTHSHTELPPDFEAMHPDIMAAAAAVGTVIAHGPVGVETVKENGQITKLIVSCKCGEQIEILCAYKNEGAVAQR